MAKKEKDLLSDYLQSLYGIDTLSVEEEHELARRIQEGDEEALDKLIYHNLRFVVYVVRNMTAWQHGKMPAEDLVAMGNEALFAAAQKWIPSNNARFATFAKSFIEKGVRRDLDNTANMIRLPVNIMEQIKRLNYNTRKLAQILGREPKVPEISIMTGFSEKKINQLQNFISREPVSIHNLRQEKHIEDFNDD